MPLAIQITIDCADPGALAQVWADALGYVLDSPPDGFATWPEAMTAWGVPESEWNSASAVVDPSGSGPRLFLRRVPEAKTAEDRMHIDVRARPGPGSPIDVTRAAVTAVSDRLVSLGASLQARGEKTGSYRAVLLDPEGKEFCVT